VRNTVSLIQPSSLCLSLARALSLPPHANPKHTALQAALATAEEQHAENSERVARLSLSFPPPRDLTTPWVRNLLSLYSSLSSKPVVSLSLSLSRKLNHTALQAALTAAEEQRAENSERVARLEGNVTASQEQVAALQANHDP